NPWTQQNDQGRTPGCDPRRDLRSVRRTRQEARVKYTFESIGMLRTPWTEKFGVPRQSLMISEAWGVLKLRPHPDYRAALSQLETFSHVWLVFVFHRNKSAAWRPIIEPPRLGVRDIGV